MTELSNLLSEGARLKARIDADTSRLREVNRALEGIAVFEDGKSTARLAADGIMAKIQRKTNVRWDQDALKKACGVMGAEAFCKVFKYEFKPKGAKELAAFLDCGKEEHVGLVRGAMTAAPGAPYVVYETVAEEQDA